ncbi:choice-of-anchor D domain-containing protein, partial [bacterium]|nr:choice-of-anchor D domain-containing protein [bacterium]
MSAPTGPGARFFTAMAFLAMSLIPATGHALSWTFTNSTEGWTGRNGTTVWYGDDHLYAYCYGNDPGIVSPSLSIPAASNSQIRFYMWTNCSNKYCTVYFKRAGSGTVYQGGQVYLGQGASGGEYTVNMGLYAEWTGTITQIRIDPSDSCGTPSDPVWVAWDYIVTEPGPPPDIRLSPTSITENIEQGNYVVKTVRIFNDGDAVLHVSGFAAVHDSPPSPPWIGNFNPTSMTIVSGSYQDLQFNLNAISLPIGSRTGRVLVYSDDPDHPTYTLPITMNVLPPPEPDISVSPSSVTEYLDIGEYVVKTVIVSNTGTATLNVSNIVAVHDSPPAPPWIGSFSTTQLSVAAGSSSSFTFNINALSLPEGTRTGRVLIYSNDPDESPYTISVTLHVAPPPEPDISITPTYVSESLSTDEYVVKTITVLNGGSAPLHVTGFTAVHDSPPSPPWIGNFNPTSLTIGAGGNSTFAFNINAISLPAGLYAGRVLIASDDPDTPSLELPVNLTVNAVVDPTVSSTSGPRGSILDQPGWGFSPGGTAELHFRRPDGSLSPTTTEAVDGQGTYAHSWLVPEDAQVGTYQYWSIDLASALVSPDVDYSVEYAPFELLSPVNGTTVTTDQVHFSWNDTGGADYYYVLVDDDPDFSSTVVDTFHLHFHPMAQNALLATSLDWGTNWFPSGQLYWKVEAYTGGALVDSALGSFQ